jgi:hypothetical protein
MITPIGPRGGAVFARARCQPYGWILDLEMVGHREDSMQSISAYVHDVPVSFVGDHSSRLTNQFLVKPLSPRHRGGGMSYEFAPHFPVTMRDLNNAVPDRVSDHAPIVVDPPLLWIRAPRCKGLFFVAG